MTEEEKKKANQSCIGFMKELLAEAEQGEAINVACVVMRADGADLRVCQTANQRAVEALETQLKLVRGLVRVRSVEDMSATERLVRFSVETGVPVSLEIAEQTEKVGG